MPANTFGELFSVTTCGESHGLALAAIVDGVPPLVELNEEMLQVDLDRRRPGSSRYGTPRNEADRVKIISGVFEGKTTGTSIGLIIENTAQRSQDYSAIMNSFRPGHADYTYLSKYGIRDYRGGGRASARETAMRVAAGGIAKQVLKQQFGITVDGCVTAIGEISTDKYDAAAALDNPFNFADESKLDELKELFKDLATTGDSVGAVVEVRAHGVKPGLGDPVFSRLDAVIASAMMGINAVKGVEIGDGFEMARMRGSTARDELTPEKFRTNHNGGILGGISSGQTIKVRIALKPTSSILVPGDTIDKDGNVTSIVTKGRHDPCVGIRAVPIAEAMLAIALLDAALKNRAQCALVPPPKFMIPLED
ncbi:MAG: chorismate synthase [Succinivibrio sp.]